MAWLSGWSYRKEITITGQSGAGTDFQVEFDIGDSAGGDFHLEGHCTNFPQDIAVTDNDGTTLLDFWIEDITADPLKLWVEVADDLGSNQSIYIYYRKSGATTDSDIENTFLFGDEFDGDLSKWTQKTGTWTIDTGKLKTPDVADVYITNEASAITFDNYIAEYRMQWLDTGDSDNTFAFNQRMNTDAFASRDGYSGYLRWGANEVRVDEHINGGATALQTETTNTETENWHKVKFTANGSSLIFYMYDEVTESTDTVTTSDDTRSSGYIGFGRYGTNSRGDTYVDYVFVRKYNSPEPAFSSAGSEETPPVTGHPWFYERKQ